jgi:hypothetical protein
MNVGKRLEIRKFAQKLLHIGEWFWTMKIFFSGRVLACFVSFPGSCRGSQPGYLNANPCVWGEAYWSFTGSIDPPGSCVQSGSPDTSHWYPLISSVVWRPWSAWLLWGDVRVTFSRAMSKGGGLAHKFGEVMPEMARIFTLLWHEHGDNMWQLTIWTQVTTKVAPQIPQICLSWDQILYIPEE